MSQIFANERGREPARRMIGPARSGEPKRRLVAGDDRFVQPLSGAVARSVAPPTQCGHPTTWRTIAHEDAIVSVLMRPTPDGELPSESFRKKEHELGVLFAQLSAIDSYELDRRLTVKAADDPIASRFSRLVPERQARLVTFVRDARRREALQSARR